PHPRRQHLVHRHRRPHGARPHHRVVLFHQRRLRRLRQSDRQDGGAGDPAKREYPGKLQRGSDQLQTLHAGPQHDRGDARHRRLDDHLVSATVRYPATLALIDGLLGPAILSAQCSFGYDQRTSTAVIRVATLPAQTLRPLTTRVILFLTSDQTKKPVLAAPRFWGYLVEFDYTLFPRSIDLLCRGPL